MRYMPAVLVALALALPTAARPQPVSEVSGPDTYLILDLGAFVPRAGELDHLDPGVAFSGTFGARFSPQLGVEGTLGYYRASGRAESGSVLVPATDASLAVVPFLVSLRLRAPLKVAELSLRAGGGLHLASFDASGPAESDTRAAFGAHVGASAAFNLSPTLLFGVDVTHTFVEAGFDDADVRLDGLLATVKLQYEF